MNKNYDQKEDIYLDYDKRIIVSFLKLFVIYFRHGKIKTHILRILNTPAVSFCLWIVTRRHRERKNIKKPNWKLFYVNFHIVHGKR